MRQAAPPTVLQLVQSNSLPALVQAEIEQLILRGELAIGRRINESDLAVRFGMSRGPIREALRALEESRLVRSEKNRGVFVREVSVAEADEIYDVREALDQLIGQRVAERATPEQLRDLAAVVAQMDDATRTQDIKGYHALNRKLPAVDQRAAVVPPSRTAGWRRVRRLQHRAQGGGRGGRRTRFCPRRALAAPARDGEPGPDAQGGGGRRRREMSNNFWE